LSSRNRAVARLNRRSVKEISHSALLEIVEREELARIKSTKSKTLEIKPLTVAQAEYDKAIKANVVTFCVGPWGTGKTYVAAYRAARALKEGLVERIIVTRPAISAEEELGALPGELDEKYEPYFRPVREALQEFLGSGPLSYYLKNGTIEARPLGFLRGATFKKAFVMLDEAQNTTPNQMKLFLTRIGDESKVVVDGDVRQKDINGLSGLEDAMRRLTGAPQIGFVRFTANDIVRSGICKTIWERYEA
jgi:phosphate starvation-inducible PhoH-like protein